MGGMMFRLCLPDASGGGGNMGQGDISVRDMVYRIWRVWRLTGRRDIARVGLTYDEAHAHCVRSESMPSVLYWDMFELVPAVLVPDGVLGWGVGG